MRAILIALSLLLAWPREAMAQRAVWPLDEWRFQRQEQIGAEAPSFDDASWGSVRLPHTWNGADGEDGGTYYRGVGWYRTSFQRPAPERRVWVEFDGAALTADVWLNGTPIGRHEGGYARFRFDVTSALRDGHNILAVRVDNARAPHIAPLGGDFTIFGGLHRLVRLIAVDPLHVDLADFGGPGLVMSAENVSDASADLRFAVRVTNDRARAQNVRVRTRLADADGRVVADVLTSARVERGATEIVRQSARLDAPRLWRGRADPHLYTLTTELLDAGGRIRDRVSLSTGVRRAEFDADQGFLLNGRPYPLYGVNYQLPGRPDRGAAARDFEIAQDFAMMDELGVTAIRFAHVQHGQHGYELADDMGIALWTEAPLVSEAAASPEFAANLTQQMRELIRQNRHHPSVVVWGLGNEVYAADDTADAAIALMQHVAKEEDATRATAYAHCCQDDLDRIALHADLGAYNRYFGWYSGEFSRIGAWADELRARRPDRLFSVSEYGAGASVLHQRDPPDRPRPDGPWHPEQYQTAFHEVYWRALRERPYLWGAFVWLAFDFASDGRNEGDRAGINDKGLASYDRATRKDAWFWYQANWSDTPMAHIVSSRLTERTDAETDVRAFSNLPRLALYLNGQMIGDAEIEDHVARWPNVRLAPGLNRVEVRGEGVTDTAYWTLRR